MSPARRTVNDRRAVAALVAVFALMLQALMPAAAMAARASPEDTGIICTATGAHALAALRQSPGAPASQKRFGGMPCQDCLAAAMAALAPAPAVIEPVTYETARVAAAPTARLLAPRARAPPRPPGQGPPTA